MWRWGVGNHVTQWSCLRPQPGLFTGHAARAVGYTLASLLCPWMNCAWTSLITNSKKLKATNILFISHLWWVFPKAQVLPFVQVKLGLSASGWGTASTLWADCDLWLDGPERQACLVASHNDCWVEIMSGPPFCLPLLYSICILYQFVPGGSAAAQHCHLTPRWSRGPAGQELLTTGTLNRDLKTSAKSGWGPCPGWRAKDSAQ